MAGVIASSLAIIFRCSIFALRMTRGLPSLLTFGLGHIKIELMCNQVFSGSALSMSSENSRTCSLIAQIQIYIL